MAKPQPTAADRRAETIRHSVQYQQLTPDERAAVEHSPLYMRAAYILQLLRERGIADAAE